jgi:cyclopropane fatty-acyl-phospholipid synthase-like methyltransferase
VGTGTTTTPPAPPRTVPFPSQFAAFVAGELPGPTRVVELGCGNGRDSIFFASYGHDVTGVDGSESAVVAASATAEANGVTANFLVSSIDDPALPERLGSATGPLMVYARFFVHAITDREEQDFLTLAAGLTPPGTCSRWSTARSVTRPAPR